MGTPPRETYDRMIWPDPVEAPSGVPVHVEGIDWGPAQPFPAFPDLPDLDDSTDNARRD